LTRPCSRGKAGPRADATAAVDRRRRRELRDWRTARPATPSRSRPAIVVPRVRTAAMTRGCMCPNAAAEASLTKSAPWLLRVVAERLSANVAGDAPCLQLLAYWLAPVASIGTRSFRPAVADAGGVRNPRKGELVSWPCRASAGDREQVFLGVGFRIPRIVPPQRRSAAPCITRPAGACAICRSPRRSSCGGQAVNRSVDRSSIRSRRENKPCGRCEPAGHRRRFLSQDETRSKCRSSKLNIYRSATGTRSP
jgi:hypothetical protein